MLSLRAVNHYYGNQHTLWNVNFELESGSCTSLVGLQGMGKSTLVNCIAGYQPVESGSIVWQGISGPPHDLLKLLPPFTDGIRHWLRPAGPPYFFADDR